MIKDIPEKLTRRDMDIMNILWKNGSSMTASQMTQQDPGLTINTVQAVIRKLLHDNLIKIDNIVYSGTVLCRSYLPTLSEDEFTLSCLTKDYQKVRDRISKSMLMASLLGSESNPDILKKDVSELQSMLDEYKKSI